MPIEKDIIYIKLVNLPLTIECNAKHSTDGDEIYHETESLVKVNAQLLVKAIINRERFLPCNRVVGILFDAKHPFIAHYILLRSRTVGIMYVRPYFGLGLMMTFLEWVCM